MNKKNIIYFIAMSLISVITLPDCSLKEDIKDELTPSVIQSDTGLLKNVVAAPLGQLRNLWWRQDFWGFQETTTDECMFPTRGTDWFDAGVWVADNTLQWSPAIHRDVIDTWNVLNTAISSANTALANIGKEKLNELPSYTRYRSQVIFLRSFYEYALLDLYRTYPTRDPFNYDFLKAPAIYKGKAAFDRLVTNLAVIVPKMVERKDALYGEPNKDAGLMLQAKLYLNKEVYTGVAGYDSCLIYVNQIINSGNYSLSTNYFNMFVPDNDKNYRQPGDEAIFVAVYNDDQNYGVDDHYQWVRQTFHYNQTIGSKFGNWNGCCATQSYLMNTWIAGTDTGTDVRWKDNSIKAAMGVNLGFNYGQQYDPKSKKALTDRSGRPLIFTFDCPLSGAAESQGVRVLKYPPKAAPISPARFANDYLIWRYADALLMKAECLVRVNSDVAGALAIVNQIRTQRKAPVVTASSTTEMLNKIYIERGLELFWEGHRRQDMIRFNTFLLAKPEWSTTTNADPKALILPIPLSAISGTPGGVLVQNPGY